MNAHRAGEISFLGVSAKLFPEGQFIHMWIHWLSKAGDPQKCWRASSNPPNIRLEQKSRGRENLLVLLDLIHQSFPAAGLWFTLVLTSRLEPKLISSTPWFSNVWTWTELYPSILHSPACHLLSLLNHTSQFLLSLCVCVCVYVCVSLEGDTVDFRWGSGLRPVAC